MFSHGKTMLCKVSNPVLFFIYCLSGIRRVKTRQERIPLLGGLLVGGHYNLLPLLVSYQRQGCRCDEERNSLMSAIATVQCL